MKLPAAASRLIFKPKRYTTIVMMLIIWAGVAGSLFAAFSVDIRTKDFMRGNAETIAQTIPVDEIKALKGNSSDEETAAYQNLKNILTKIRLNNSDTRFVYLLGSRDGKAFFYADAESPTNTTYSPPGQNYPKTSRELTDLFTGGQEALIEGPRRDVWGFWISALAPVIDDKNGEVVAVVGLDRPAVTYYLQLLSYAIVPLLLSAIPLVGLIRDRKLESKQYEITQLKNQFVSIASHELRSPLAGMMWAIQSLLKDDEGLSKKQKSLLTDMFRSSEASLATVNEILDLSIFERGQAGKLQQDMVDLPTVLKEVCATLKLGAQEKHLKIEFEDWPEHAYVIGDVSALKRAYMNILANAIKYTKDRTSVIVHYRHSAGEHIVSIRDQGIGIPLKEQTKVMEGYYRASNAAAVQSHGTGLGLWVTRMVLEQHKGRLWLNSKLNHGTTIFTALPAAHSPASVVKD